MKFFSIYFNYSFDDDEIIYLYNSRDDGRERIGCKAEQSYILFSPAWKIYSLALKEQQLNTKRSFTADII